ncbi:MAG: hypothetical protein VB081_09210 [Christensenella sp.]|uniref:hypothetical protein n=1 Tax=Christensenella sp. TaxID=1935934 RepID=UPI002B206BF6|nr:hypothetical protein [Christensenella sp.]MEA5003664.1 hypothetical protein [Christensenella sp.]
MLKETKQSVTTKKMLNFYHTISAEDDRKQSIWAFGIACIIAVISAVFYYISVLDHKMIYTDIVMDYPIYGQYKNADYETIAVFFVVFLIVYLVTSWLLNRKQIPSVRPLGKSSNGASVWFTVALIILAICLLKNYYFTTVSFTIDVILILFFVILAIYLLYYRVEKRIIIQTLIGCYVGNLSFAGLMAFASHFSVKLTAFAEQNIVYYYITYIVLCGIVAIAVKARSGEGRKRFSDKLSLLTQFFAPAALLILITHRYFLDGEIFAQPYFSKFKTLVLLVILVLLAVNLVTLIKYAKRKINTIKPLWITTLIVLTVVVLWNTPSLVINPDGFHTGETEIVWQQIMEFGQAWNTEFVSVLQGLGMMTSGINALLFGGTFATYVFANYTLYIVVAVITMVLLYHIVPQKWLLIIFLIFVPQLLIINRLYFILPSLLILALPYLTKRPIIWSYVYIGLCLFNLWYQPTYGGAIMVGVLPVWIYMLIRARKQGKLFGATAPKQKRNTILFLVSIAGILIVCLPYLLSTLHFISSNGTDTVITNGTAFEQTWMNFAAGAYGGTPLAAFLEIFVKSFGGLLACAFLLFMLVRYVLKEKGHTLRVQGLLLTLSAVLIFLIAIPAVYTRIDANGISRVGCMVYIFVIAILPLLCVLYWNRIQHKRILLVFLAALTLLPVVNTNPGYFSYVQKAVDTTQMTSEEVAYHDPEVTGIEGLGYTLVPKDGSADNYMEEITALTELLDKLEITDEQSYYDTTNENIYYKLSGKKVPGLYAAGLVVPNSALQKDVIERLQQSDVPVYFFGQKPEFTPISIRAYRVYRYLLESGYELVKYKGSYFLVRGDIDLSPLQTQSIFRSENQTDSAMNALDKVEKRALTQPESINDLRLENGNYVIEGEDPFLVFDVSDQSIVTDAPLVLAQGLGDEKEGNIQIFFESETVQANEENAKTYAVTGKEVLLPAKAGIEGEQIQKLRIDFDGFQQGDAIPEDGMILYQPDEETFRMFDGNASSALYEEFDQRYCWSDLMYLPQEWGRNFEKMTERFRETTGMDCVYDDVTGVNSLTPKDSVAGKNAEFLLVDAGNEIISTVNATVKVYGIDRYGNDFIQEFQLATQENKLLIPIGTSARCLLADQIENVEIRFTDAQGGAAGIAVKEAEFYELVG